MSAAGAGADAALRYCHVESPVGLLLLAGDDAALRFLSFPSGHRAFGPKPGWRAAEAAPFAPARAQLAAYFAGRLARFDLPLALGGTPFQNEVWRYLPRIGFGETRGYGEIARALGRPGASRAVGAANGANPLPIILPCHRVIGASGALTGFGGGLPVKRFLLALEGARIEGARVSRARVEGARVGRARPGQPRQADLFGDAPEFGDDPEKARENAER